MPNSCTCPDDSGESKQIEVLVVQSNPADTILTRRKRSMPLD